MEATLACCNASQWHYKFDLCMVVSECSYFIKRWEVFCNKHFEVELILFMHSGVL